MSSPPRLFLFLAVIITTLGWTNGGVPMGVERKNCDYPADPPKDPRDHTYFTSYGREVAAMCDDFCGGKALISRCRMMLQGMTVTDVQCFCKGSVSLDKVGPNALYCRKSDKPSEGNCSKCAFTDDWAKKNLKPDGSFTVNSGKGALVCIERKEYKEGVWTETPDTCLRRTYPGGSEFIYSESCY